MGFLDSIQANIPKMSTANAGGANKFDAQIAETDSQISNLLMTIGKIYLDAHRDTCEPEYESAVQSIKELEIQRETLERNKLAAQGLRKCEHCKQIITLDSAFCNKCGSKLEPIVADSVGGKFCPSCGASIEADAAFCTSCGAKLS